MSATYLETLINHRDRQKNKGNGFGFCIVNAPNRGRRIANTILATGGSGKERNLVIQRMPQFDPENHIVKKKKGGLNTHNIRIMTPTEWGRLQGFIGYGFVDDNGIDHFSFPEGMPESQKYKQFGNSVSIPVIETMAYHILECLDIFYAHKEHVVTNYLRAYGSITKRDISELFDISDEEARVCLRELRNDGVVCCTCKGRNAKYRLI